VDNDDAFLRPDCPLCGHPVEAFVVSRPGEAYPCNYRVCIAECHNERAELEIHDDLPRALAELQVRDIGLRFPSARGKLDPIWDDARRVWAVVSAAAHEARLYEAECRLDSDRTRLLVKIKGVEFAVRLLAADQDIDQDIAAGLERVASMRPPN